MGFTFLDMFCGAGGSSWGARMAGGRLVGAIDEWSLAAETIKENHPETIVLNRRLGPTSRPSGSLPSTVDLLLASPECTNHSCAKGAAPRSEDSRGTANYVLNYAQALSPRWIVIENVIQMRSWAGYQPLVSRLTSLGYKVKPQVLDAADFGVPQTRRRLFLLCDREADPELVKLPAGMKRKSARSIIQFDGPWRSTPLNNGRRAQATLDRAERAIDELGRNEPFLIVYYGSDGSGGWQTLDRPLRTLTTLDRFALVTWRGNVPYMRMLQVDELKAAMGFPTDYKLNVGSRRDRIKLLGNGVCPPVMAAIVKAMISPSDEKIPSDGLRDVIGDFHRGRPASRSSRGSPLPRSRPSSERLTLSDE